MSKAKYIIGPDHLAIISGKERIYDVLTHRSEKDQLEIEHNLDIVRELDVQPDGFEYDLHLDDSEVTEAEKIFYSVGTRNAQLVIGVHFGTLDVTRRLPLRTLARVIDWIKAHYDCEVVLIVGPNERKLQDQVLRMVRSQIRIAPVMPIRIAAAFIKRLQLFLCNDTGTLHIASAMKVPTVSFHSMNDPAVWKPPHERHVAVRADDAKITSITVEQITEAIERQLADYSRLKL